MSPGPLHLLWKKQADAVDKGVTKGGECSMEMNYTRDQGEGAQSP